ncbi:membrane protein [Lactococcus hodotermopsidis]|uniref:Membrane protein n=1 Tax=Pseudolactococcus hodotermopsidis TaxID=2709157 RepID=A0A6A0BE06_9LACT|nr:TIGR01906 family membrane protein [Lactococcus hodotermopsidis]GFH42578.1 membrane protein [Lactococcus hodotermopsidis]
MKDKIHFFITILWSIAAGASLTILAAIPLFHSLVGVFKLSESTFLSKEIILHNFDVLMTYLLNPFVKKLVMPDFPSSADGLKHFVDVKHLFILAFVVTVVLLFPTILFVKKKLYLQFYQTLKICLLMPILVGIIALFGGFDSIFISFHKLFFRDSTWLFDPATDPVIDILPENFFMLCFIVFGAIYLAFWGILYVKSKLHFDALSQEK